MLHQK
ncbi:hypothetical protein VCCP103710_3309, partial [Vibrio cholerae CP1037(10)]